MISSIDTAKIKKILVFTLSNIGDVILNTPVISLLRENFPASSISVLVGPKAASIFTGSHTVNEVIAFDKHASWFRKIALVFQLRKKKFDLVIDLRNTAIAFLIGAKYSTSFFVDRTAASMRDRHLDRVRFLIPVEEKNNRFDFYSETEKKSAFQKFKAQSDSSNGNDYIVIAPGAGGSLKRWTIDGFSEVMNYFLEKNKNVVLLGWDLERELGAELERKASRPVINLIGSLSLRESAAVISNASLVIVNDSAVMHLAHELNRPTVSIFGPTDHKKYGQTGNNRRMIRLDLECSPCEVAQCRLERRICLDDLPAHSVIEASEELLTQCS